jgi:putative inorganic carbon (hco3(-)) transporter
MGTATNIAGFADAKAGLTTSLLIAGSLLALLVATTMPGLPTTFAFSGLALIFAFFRVNIFLYSVIFLLPLSPVVSTGLPLRNISTFVELLMFAGLFLRQARDGQSIRDWFFGSRLKRLALALVATFFVCTFVVNHASVSSWRGFSEFLAGFCLFLTVTAWIRTQGEVELLLRIILSSSILVSVFGFYQAAAGNYTGFYEWLYPNLMENLGAWTGRITSVLNYPNSLAGFLDLILPIALGLLLIRTSRNNRLLAGAALACGAGALVLTTSRGGFASFLAELLLAAVYLTRRAASRKWLLLAGLVVALAGVLLFFGFVRSPWVEEDESTAIRFLFWGFASSLFLSSPVVGVGYGNFRDLYDIPGIASGIYDVHNLYLQLLAETGLLGFAAFFLMIFHAVRKCLSALKEQTQDLRAVVNFAALAAVLSVLLHGFVDFLFIVSPQFTLLFWLVLALVAVAGRWKADSALAMGKARLAR